LRKAAIGGVAPAQSPLRALNQTVRLFRKALNTGSWELASEMVRVMEAGGPSTAIMVKDAIERFLADATARNLSESSLKKYRVFLQGRRSS